MTGGSKGRVVSLDGGYDSYAQEEALLRAAGFELQLDVGNFECGIDGLCEVPYGQQGNVQSAQGFHFHTGFGVDFCYCINVNGMLVLPEVRMY